MRSLIEHGRSRLMFHLRQSLTPLPLLCGQESAESKMVGAEASSAQRRHHRGHARNGHHPHPRIQRRAHQSKARVGDQRRSCISHESDVRAAQHTFG